MNEEEEEEDLVGAGVKKEKPVGCTSCSLIFFFSPPSTLLPWLINPKPLLGMVVDGVSNLGDGAELVLGTSEDEDVGDNIMPLNKLPIPPPPPPPVLLLLLLTA